MALHLSRRRAALEPLTGQLVQLSPMKILERGYAIVRDADGHVIKDAGSVDIGTELQVLLARGRLQTEVKDKET
jgi:exodeoxyribonuclease VII large subunit